MQGKRIREWDPFVQGVQWPLIAESLLYSLLPLLIWGEEEGSESHTHTYTDYGRT